jgi:hypothetical protein
MVKWQLSRHNSSQNGAREHLQRACRAYLEQQIPTVVPGDSPLMPEFESGLAIHTTWGYIVGVLLLAAIEPFTIITAVCLKDWLGKRFGAAKRSPLRNSANYALIKDMVAARTSVNRRKALIRSEKLVYWRTTRYRPRDQQPTMPIRNL